MSIFNYDLELEEDDELIKNNESLENIFKKYNECTEELKALIKERLHK